MIGWKQAIGARPGGTPRNAAAKAMLPTLAALLAGLLAGALAGCGAEEPAPTRASRGEQAATPVPEVVETPPPSPERIAEVIAVARQVGDDELAEYMARLQLESSRTPSERAAALALVTEILLDAGHHDEVPPMIEALSALDAERGSALRARLEAGPPEDATLEALLRERLAAQDEAGDALAGARTRGELGRLLVESGRPKDAVPLFERAEADLREALDRTSMRIVRVPSLHALARMRMDTGDRHAARLGFEEAHSMRLDAAPASAWVHAEAELAYAEFLMVDGHAREALDLARRAVERLLATFGAEVERTRSAIRRAAAVDVLPDAADIGHDHEGGDGHAGHDHP